MASSPGEEEPLVNHLPRPLFCAARCAMLRLVLTSIVALLIMAPRVEWLARRCPWVGPATATRFATALIPATLIELIATTFLSSVILNLLAAADCTRVGDTIRLDAQQGLRSHHRHHDFHFESIMELAGMG